MTRSLRIKPAEAELERLILQEQREATCKAAYQVYHNAPFWANAAFVAGAVTELKDAKFRTDFLRIVITREVKLPEIIEGANNLVRVLQQLVKA